MAYNVSYIYEVIDHYTAKLKKINQATDTFKKKISEARAKSQATADALNYVAKRAAIATAAAAGGAIYAAKGASNFEAAMAGVQRAMNDLTTQEDFDIMRQQIKGLAHELGMLPDEMADAAAAAGRMGIGKGEMKDYLFLVGQTANAFDMVADEASKALGEIRGHYNLTIQGTNDMADAIAFLENTTRAAGKDMIDVIQRTSGTLATLNVPPEVAASLAAFSRQVSVSSETAATGLNILINGLIQAGYPIEKFRKNFTGSLGDILQKYKGMSDAQRKAIDEALGDRAARFLKSASNQMSEYTRIMASTADKTNFLGSLQNEYNITMATTNMKVKKATSAFAGLRESIGRTLLPHTKVLTKHFDNLMIRFTNFIDKHPELTRNITMAAVAIGTLVAGLASIGASMVFLFPFVSSMGGFAAIFSAIGTAAAPIVAILAGVAAGGFLFYKVIKKLAANKEFMTQLNSIHDKLKELMPSTETLATVVITSFKLMGKVVDYIATNIANKIKAIVWIIEKVTNLLPKLQAAYDKISPFMDIANAVRTGNVSKLGETGMLDWTKNLFDKAKGFLGFEKEELSLSSRREITTNNRLNGDINVNVHGPGNVSSASMTKNMPGNLGFNLAPEVF